MAGRRDILHLALQHKEIIFPILRPSSLAFWLYPSTYIQYSCLCVVFSKVCYWSYSLEGRSKVCEVDDGVQETVCVFDCEAVVGHGCPNRCM